MCLKFGNSVRTEISYLCVKLHQEILRQTRFMSAYYRVYSLDQLYL